MTKKREPELSHADRAIGFVTCLACKAWPDVRFVKMRRKADSYWSAICPNVCSGHMAIITGGTRDEIKGAWNHQHRRIPLGAP